MWRCCVLSICLLGVSFGAEMSPRSTSTPELRMTEGRYLRVSTARWNINLYSPKADRIFRQIDTEGVAVFRAQRGFVRT